MKSFIYGDDKARPTDCVTMEVLFHAEDGKVDLSFHSYAVVGYDTSRVLSRRGILYSSLSFDRCAEKYESYVLELARPDERKGD